MVPRGLLPLLLLVVKFQNTKGGLTISSLNCTRNIRTIRKPLLKMKCLVQKIPHSLWKWENDKLFAGTTRITYDENIDIDDKNYSLILRDVDYFNDGRYVCMERGETILDYCLEVVSIPRVAIFVDNMNVSHHFDGIIDKQYNITCKVVAAKPILDVTWERNGLAMDTGIILTENNDNTHTFDISKSMIYTGVNSGEVLTCRAEKERYFSVSTSFFFQTFDDTILLTINNDSSLLRKTIHASSPYLIRCQPEDERFESNLTIYVDVELGSGTQAVANVSLLITKDLEVNVNFPRNVLRTWLACDLLAGKVKNHVDVVLQVSVSPVIQFQLQNANITNYITTFSGDLIRLTCIAYSARSFGRFVWDIGNGDVTSDKNDIEITSNKFHPGTYNVKSEFTITPLWNITVSCSHVTTYDGETRKVVDIIAVNVSIPDKKFSTVNAIIIFIMLMAVVMFATGVCSGRLKGLFSPGNERVVNNFQLDRDNSLIEIPLTVRRPPSIKPPDRPMMPSSAKPDENDDDRYHSLVDGTSCTTIIDRTNLCLVTRLSEGIIFQRWLGTFQKSKAEKTYVTISMPKDTICRLRYNWDTFAKKILELPTSCHVAHCEGLSIEGEHLLVVQTYMQTKDLGCCLSENRKSCEDTSFVALRSHFAFQVLLAMEFLVSHGFAHPGLSIEKILVTKDKVCQLYDFCNRNEAPRVLEDMKNEGRFNVQKHPPEAVARNEHDLGSDVWYTAFVIWQLFSSIDSVAVKCEDIQCEEGYMKWIFEEVGPSTCFTKPPSCPDEIFKILQKCWSLQPALRPAFSLIRATFLEDELFSKNTQSLSEKSAVPNNDVSSVNSYVSMKGNVDADVI